MIPPEAFASPVACGADPGCGHAACFQVQLEASPPQRAYRQALACAYHVADVIEALRSWAREQDLAGGQLIVLAIEPAERQPRAEGRYQAENRHQDGGSSGPKTAVLREFAFGTIPLKTVPPDPAPHREPTS